jgi:hypothetical protein
MYQFEAGGMYRSGFAARLDGGLHHDNQAISKVTGRGLEGGDHGLRHIGGS